MKWPICGPKLSLCCSVISVWGIIQFVLLGIFFFVEAGPLLDDFDVEYDPLNPAAFEGHLKDAFHTRAINCWIAAAIYVVLLVFAGVQFRTHLQKSSTPNTPISVTSPLVGVTSEENGYGSQHGIQFSNDERDTNIN